VPFGLSAMPLYTDVITVPADTAENSPVTKTFEVWEDYITLIGVYFPPGCIAKVKVRCFYGSEQIAPLPKGSYFVGDGALISAPMRWKIPEKPCPIRFEACSPGTLYQHSPVLYIETMEEEEAKPYKILNDFVSILKRLMGL